MNRQDKVELAVFSGLVLAGSLARVLLSDWPNFAPVAAIALFAGYFFRSRAVALFVPLTVMGISDFFIGSYDWQMMAIVYGALMLPVFARGVLRRWFSLDNGASPLRATAGLLTSSLGASISFFAISNFGAWVFYGTYEHTFAGLTHCYVQAIPFFRYTLAGDLFFALVLFGSYALAMSFAVAAKPAPQAISR
ncbi:MAG TPA: hypothetical protein P5307_04500 [Pirellulaceae bacterium]|nr:hypothetical protein [Planctomycetales bacterium]MCB9940999.1 hypothetical protein [Planctomycetaceae bacterium]HRX78296.1 hypothetical protein [Pirellulaceae bacterium]